MNNFNDILKIISNFDYTSEDEKNIRSFFKSNVHNNIIINKLSHLKNPYIYIALIHLIENDVDVSIIEEKRVAYIKKVLNNSVNLSLDWVKEYIIYYFFKDNYYNFLVNYNNMLIYMKYIGKILIPLNHVYFYNQCINLNKMDLDNQLKLFNQYADNNISEMFYDDMRIVKNHSYNDLVSNTLNLKSNVSIYNKKLSEQYGVLVYFLNGEEFHAFVRYFIADDNIYNKDNLYCKLPKEYYSFSYIGDKNIGTIGKIDFDGILLMYQDIDPNYITHVHHTDSASSVSSNRDVFISKKINEIHSSKSIIRDTEYYNEIVVKKTKNGIIPTSIVCFDEIKDKDLEVAHKYNLPIVLINSKKYYYDDGYPDFSSDNNYCL